MGSFKNICLGEQPGDTQIRHACAWCIHVYKHMRVCVCCAMMIPAIHACMHAQALRRSWPQRDLRKAAQQSFHHLSPCFSPASPMLMNVSPSSSNTAINNAVCVARLATLEHMCDINIKDSSCHGMSTLSMRCNMLLLWKLPQRW